MATLKDVINNFNELNLTDVLSSKYSIFEEFKRCDFYSFTKKQYNNLADFVTSLPEKESIYYILFIVDNFFDNNQICVKFLKQKKLKKYIKIINEGLEKKSINN